jgi:hypothetical protein
MDRDRLIESEADRTVHRSDRTLIPEPAPVDRVAGEPSSSRDAAGDALAPTDQDVLVRSDAAETMPSRPMVDPRELTADQKTRLSVSSTVASDLTAHQEALFAQIREGMRVVDADGKNVGKVELVSMGDPEAVTTAGQEMAPTGGVLGDVARALTDFEGEPDVPEPLRSQLVRTGYVKVDGPGWIDTDRYLTAEMIASVTADEVRLAAPRDALPTAK